MVEAGRNARDAMARGVQASSGETCAQTRFSECSGTRSLLHNTLPLTSLTAMLRLTRPLFQRVTKLTTGIHGIDVHPSPLPALTKVYEDTLSTLSQLPQGTIYRQGTEAVVRHKLNIVNAAQGDIEEAEKNLDEGQIEESLMIAQDELGLVAKMTEWRAWESLETKPEPGQWEYFGRQSDAA